MTYNCVRNVAATGTLGCGALVSVTEELNFKFYLI